MLAVEIVNDADILWAAAVCEHWYIAIDFYFRFSLELSTRRQWSVSCHERTRLYVISLAIPFHSFDCFPYFLSLQPTCSSRVVVCFHFIWFFFMYNLNIYMYYMPVSLHFTSPTRSFFKQKMKCTEEEVEEEARGKKVLNMQWCEWIHEHDAHRPLE